VEGFLATIREDYDRIDNSEQAVWGRALYDAIFRCYTRKHWASTPASSTGRGHVQPARAAAPDDSSTSVRSPVKKTIIIVP
jgi:hypothetical protein